MNHLNSHSEQALLEFNNFKSKALEDYKLVILSRECSNLSRREVLTGKAKFGIFGDGKELAQICLSKFFKNGDFRSGYYRDQTLLFANDSLTVREYFFQLYAHSDLDKEPNSGGRQMNCHFSTRLLDEHENWKSHLDQKNTTSDISCTAGQMPRAIGIAQASKLYRQLTNVDSSLFSEKGNEVCFATIGDASTSEGHFFESVNAMCTLQIPIVLSIWDDGYGISVPWEYQRSKKDISEILCGFQRTESQKGCEIIKVSGWNYLELIKAYEKAEKLARQEHIPVIIHVYELTQPQGHSTSGSHERYKSKDRMIFEKEFDCLVKFREWILSFSFTDHQNNTHRIISENELSFIEQNIKNKVREILKQTWQEYQNVIYELKNKTIEKITNLLMYIPGNKHNKINSLLKSIESKKILFKKDIFILIKNVLRETKNFQSQKRHHLVDYLNQIQKKEKENYSSHLYGESNTSAIKIPFIKPKYNHFQEFVDGRIIIRDNFEVLFNKYPKLIAFGEDVGKIGDVNQGMEGLQEKFGKIRISDTGIREATIVGQAIGLAIRGFRPIAEIQYLDYIYYGLQILSDDVATLRYRTRNGQKVPLIIRTRGHRLEGIWHAGSPMGVLINSLRGIYLLVPRNFIRAAGFYNTMLQSNDDPCIIIESLNGYRLKERKLINLGEFTTPVGKIEITNFGIDVTVVTYGSVWKNVIEAKKKLDELGVSIEIIDCQSLIPFDLSHETVESIKKTNRLVVIDEDVPGGASAYLLQKILEEQNAYRYLDAKPITITAKEHRCAYGTDGNYFSKPSTDDIIDGIYQLMHEYNPHSFPNLY